MQSKQTKLNATLSNIEIHVGYICPLFFLRPFFHSLQEMQKAFARYKTLMLSLNLGGQELQCEASAEMEQVQESLHSMNRGWAEACTGLEVWEDSLRNSFMHCQVRTKSCSNQRVFQTWFTQKLTHFSFSQI